MSNIEQQAAEVIADFNVCGHCESECGQCQGEAHALAEAGLLKDDTELNRIKQELEERVRVWQKTADKLEVAESYGLSRSFRDMAEQVKDILEGNES